MTINKIGMSVFAASILTTAAFAAGTLTTGATANIASELILNADVDVNLSTPILYTNDMAPATASEAGFELKFSSNVTNLNSDGNLSIMKADDNTTIATFDVQTGSSIIFKTESGSSLVRGVEYKIVSDDNATLSSTALTFTVPKGGASVTTSLVATDNTGVTTLDTTNSTELISVKSQFAGSFTTKLDAQIDASASFLTFISAGITDNYGFSFTNLAGDLTDGNVTVSKVDYVLYPDRNLSTYGLSIATVTAGTNFAFTTATVNDMNITIPATTPDANGTDTTDYKVTVAPTDGMQPVNFTASATVAYSIAGTPYTTTLLDKVDAGKWSIYGYNAQIPTVGGIPGFDTVIKFTNRSSIDTDIYLTLIDPDGTIETLNSVDNSEIASLPANATGKYRASDLLKLIDNADFNKAASFSLEVSIPTTPDSVYGMASFKNTKLGQFKDLPIYNTSSLTN